MTSPFPVSPEAFDDELYAALRTLASSAWGHSPRFDATELVHRAWLRLARSKSYADLSRPQFLALCATIMRRIAVDEGRRRNLEPRSGNRITLGGVPGEHDDEAERSVDLLALDDALEQLHGVEPRWARIVELRFFAGLTADEVSAVLGVSRSTVTRDWILARAWLKRRLR